MHQGRSSALAPAFAHLCVGERAMPKRGFWIPDSCSAALWRSMTTCQYSSVCPALHDAVATDGLESVGSGELSGSPDMEPCTRLPMLLPAGMPGNYPVAVFCSQGCAVNCSSPSFLRSRRGDHPAGPDLHEGRRRDLQSISSPSNSAKHLIAFAAALCCSEAANPFMSYSVLADCS